MSYWAGYSGQGLVLDSQEFHEFLEIYAKVAGKEDKGVKQLDEYVEGDIGIEEVEFAKPGTDKTFTFHAVDDSCCEGFRLWPYRIEGKKNEDWESADVPDNVYILDSDKLLDGMNAFDGKPIYASYEEFVQEFKDKMAAYLPDDFDWDGHIGIYSYACFA